MEPEIDEGAGVGTGHHEDGPAVAAVAAAWATAGDKLLAAERQTSASAAASFDVNVDFVNEHKEELANW
jgi:hypothetical protein